jgi:hypothetical protein
MTNDYKFGLMDGWHGDEHFSDFDDPEKDFDYYESDDGWVE